MSRFSDAIPGLLKREGGFVNNKADRGGATNYGITQRTYDAWMFSQKLSHRDVSLLSVSEAKLIYLQQYWTPIKCEELPDIIREIHFDAAVNHGPTRAAKMLQEAARVTADGVIGPATIKAAQEANPDALLARYIAIRYKFYGAIINRDRSQLVFIVGWLNRLDEFS